MKKESRGIGSIVASIVGIIIIVAVAIILVKVLIKEPPVNELITITVDLRNAETSLQKANLITKLDDLVIESDSEEVINQWERMMDCMPTACPDEAYLDMILIITSAFEPDIPQSRLLINLIATAKYWGNEEKVLDFSKSMSIANTQIEQTTNRKAEKAWQAIVDCNNVCEEKNNLYFELIKTIVQ
ncbi:hypothetical protein COV18_06330 [Candidatus Woesearchaeota archaeon CG10_big_fil_rev_8_21_14_0_10_37_12]|nr:MAG: hypothetical protein COV18_06330 [Candidatus Woesearchaeota archaeon CG10_big_fil_rev_8_21_14_0_10_37_12]